MTGEKTGSRAWMLDKLGELGEQLPRPTPANLDQAASTPVRQLARAAFQQTTEVLGYAEEACTRANNRLQQAIEADDDEAYDYADEAVREAETLRNNALADRERALIYFSRELGRAWLAREQAKANLDSQYNAGDKVFKFGLAPIQDQAYETLKQADGDFYRIRERVLGQIVLDG